MKMDNNKYEIQIIITPIQSQPTTSTFIPYDATTIWNGVLDICFFLDIYARA